MLYTHTSRDYVLKPFNFLSSSKENILFIDIIKQIDKDIYEFSLKLNSIFPDRIIFGLGYKEGKYSIEYYIYNSFILPKDFLYIKDFFYKLNVELSIPIPSILLSNDTKYFMFSFDILDQKTVGNIDIYEGDYNFRLQENRAALRRNTYNFFKKYQMDKIVFQLERSTHYGFSQSIKKIIEYFSQFLYNTGTICVSKKSSNDGIYFSRINYFGFLSFLKIYKWDTSMLNFFLENDTIYRNYMFDIGIDYLIVEGKIKTQKTSFCFLLGNSNVL